MKNMISLQNIHKYYYSDNSAAIGIRKVNLNFEIGEFVVITGESGSGKTTLLNVISGMDTYEEGEMYFGQDATSQYDNNDWEDYRRNHISFIYQSYNLIDSYTVLENVESVLMICQKKFGEMSKKERRKYCMEYLEQVGLEKQAGQKAARLSSGQKQRLGIARALAKNTDVIIADEPTGNLDSENGMQIIKLLHDLSKEKLVIMVTHNYEQAAPYATRKLRMSGGEVAEDICLNDEKNKSGENSHPEAENKKTESKKTVSEKSNRTQKGNAVWGTAWKFVRLNHKAQPYRSFFLFFFLLLSALAGIVFQGNFLANLDDTSTKIINHDVFRNTDEKRLIVRKINGDSVTQEDVDKIKKIEHVKETDLYDNVNDISYFYKKNEDYKVNYETADENLRNKIEPEFLDDTKFMRSASCLEESDLSTGELPKDFNHIVLYSEDESLLGEEITFYFQDTKYWNKGVSVCLNMKVCGILKENREQVYFSTDLCQAFHVRYNDYYGKASYEKIKEIKYKDSSKEDYRSVSENDFDAIFIPNEELKKKEMKISQNYFLNVPGETKKYKTYTQREFIGEQGTISYKDETDKIKTVKMKLREEGSLSVEGVVEISPEMFAQMYPNNETNQINVFLEDYSYTDEVIEQLGKDDYEAISIFRISAVTYDEDKVTQRFVTLGICGGAFIVLLLFDVIVLYVLMKLKNKDYMILKSLGMQQKIIVKMNILDLISTVMPTQIIACIITYLLMWRKVRYISSFLQYYHVQHWIFLWMFALCLAVITAGLYNRTLKQGREMN